MSKEAQHPYQIQPDITQKQSGGNIVSDTTFDTKAKTAQIILPSDSQSKPDFMQNRQFSESQINALEAAGRLVREMLEDERFEAHLSKLEENLPLTYEHSVRVGMISGYLAHYFGLPEAMQRIAVAAGINHDIGKLEHHPAVRWESTRWSPEERIANARAVEMHSQDSARLIRDIDPSLELPVLLHHAFQEEPYPNPNEYIPELEGDDLTVVRIIALADQTEAVFTRSQANNNSKTDDQMKMHLRQHTLDGKEIPAFSEREIEEAIAAYRMMGNESFSQAA